MDCKHSNAAIVAHALQAQGYVEAYDAVYRMSCPWDGRVHRNTRLAATIHVLRGLSWDITTVRGGGHALAVYRLVKVGQMPRDYQP